MHYNLYRFRENYNWLLIPFCFIFSIWKGYQPWDQVVDLWLLNDDLTSLVFHPHFYRYLVVYLGFLIEDVFPGVGYSVFSAIFVVIIVNYFQKLSQFHNRKVAQWYSLAILFTFIYFMNGRGLIAWAAWLICIDLCCQISCRLNYLNFCLKISICLLFASVSSGVFVVVLFTLVLLCGPRLLVGVISSEGGVVLKLLFFITLLIVIYFSIGYFIESTRKNLDFFDNDIFNMLTHGVGLIFSELNVAIVGLIGFLVLNYLFFMFIKYKGSFVFWIALIPLASGFWGFTVLTLFFPVILAIYQPVIRIFSKE